MTPEVLCYDRGGHTQVIQPSKQLQSQLRSIVKTPVRGDLFGAKRDLSGPELQFSALTRSVPSTAESDWAYHTHFWALYARFCSMAVVARRSYPVS